ncbi:MAG: nucleotidyltransferase family protein, partial [Clostridia bacterium]|nr:nucleotidyltransferase family protein [Clostridia bacterium]
MQKNVLPDTILPILLAGGMGTRLSPITADLPKPLVPIDGTPVLCRTLVTLASLGVRRAVVTVRYRADDIITLLGDEYAGVRLFYSREDAEPLGTAGGVRAAWERYAHDTDTDALVISGDAVFTCDLAAFAAFHAQKHAAASLL